MQPSRERCQIVKRIALEALEDVYEDFGGDFEQPRRWHVVEEVKVKDSSDVTAPQRLA